MSNSFFIFQNLTERPFVWIGILHFVYAIDIKRVIRGSKSHNLMAKRKKTKRQTIVHKTLHKKQMNKKHEPN